MPQAISAETYGIVVDDRLDSALIKLGLDALSSRQVGKVVFFSLSPHDIRTRKDWPEIVRHIRSEADAEGHYEVRQVESPEELLEASLEMKLVRLPVDTHYSRM
ncbi:MAG: hypothetical protein K0S28_236 [Paucimonas sp.]|nr:hypothetical protein [Paucimonas sp.]